MKTETFSEGKGNLVTFLWPNITYKASPCYLGNTKLSFNCPQSFTNTFLVFSHDFGRNFLWTKSDFSNDSQIFLKFSALSVPKIDGHHLSRQTD